MESSDPTSQSFAQVTAGAQGPVADVAAGTATESVEQKLAAGLNPPQAEAVVHKDGPILVLAGAGSGKTRVLTRRVSALVLQHGIHPRNILAVTFTNKATEEMRHRLGSLLGDRGRYLWVATFHAAALRILRHFANRLGFTNNFVVYDDQDSKGLIKSLLKEHNIDEKKISADMVARAIDSAKNFYVSPEELSKRASAYNERIVASLYGHYQEALRAANAFDFGDLLFKTVELLEGHPEVLMHYRDLLHYILVDEFQDTNPVQYRLIRLLAEPRKNLFVVGDDDQSIYAFRGATISNILNFERDFPGTKVVRLEQNYRSTGNILDTANALIKKNKSRKGKTLWTSAGKGAPINTRVCDDETDEAQFVAQEIAALKLGGRAYKDIAIFYRTNAQSRALEEALSVSGIPYRIFGGLKFYDRKEIKDLLAYLRLIVNPSDTQAFSRAVNTPTRGVGAQTVLMVSAEAKQSGVSVMEAAKRVADRNRGLAQFVALMERLTELSHKIFPADLVQELTQASGYLAKLSLEKDPTNESRIENIQELVSIARFMEFGAENPRSALENFLDRVALTSGSDGPVEGQPQQSSDSSPSSGNDQGKGAQGTPPPQPESVSLMTLHLAKGLEFPVVFFTGLEEGLVPHYRSIDDPVGIEEERRLCYVGITRAMERLYLSRAVMRGLFASGGNSGYRMVSRFAADLPDECLNHLNGPFISTVFSSMNFGGGSVGSPRSQYSSSQYSSSQYGGSAHRDSQRHYRSDNEDYTSRDRFNQSKGSGGKFGRWQERSDYGDSDDSSTGSRPASAGKRLIQQKLEKTQARVARAAQAVKSAEELPTLTGPLASPEDLKPGTIVRHQSFGRGVVEATEGDLAGNGHRFKITVRFDGVGEPKKLLYKFARLVLDRS